MKKSLVLAAAVFAVLLTGCADSEVIVVPQEPGFVGIDDRAAAPSPPKLTVTYFDNTLPGNVTVTIKSHVASDGDVAYDPVADAYFETVSPPTLLFGVDSSDPNFREYRAFLDFRLDGSDGQDVVASGAPIVSATLMVFLTEVSFAPVVPCFLDLVTYPRTGPTLVDFGSAYLSYRSLTLYDTDAGSNVAIAVTTLMQEAQDRDLADFQVRFMVR